MREERFPGGPGARLYRCNTAVVGTGAAGYNAADRLWQFGQKDVLVVAENRLAGTSRNAGSDKQTYYKLTLSGAGGDSVQEMAASLFDGGCVDGDTALCEAALSVRSFFRLVELGVPFPHDRWGQYVGYKTDHDPRQRATSVGPYTSKQMTERLEQAVLDKGIPVLDHLQVIQVLSDKTRVFGLLCLDVTARDPGDRFVLIRCKNVVYATGAPAGMYADSVYPLGHCGATGLALEAGVQGRNLTEWQYGMASVSPRWNVSGTYMQVLPRVCSTAADGTDEREFLLDAFPTVGEMLSKLFLKGYQWPFDARKAAQGSSQIDLFVYRERCKGRRVFLDYRANPAGGAFSYEDLWPEAREYLERAGACFGTPIQRLLHMNAPAVEFYKDKGVDLAAQPLEISICAQHNNGGLAVDSWWQTNVEGFFAVGEVSGTHGVYRPGGSALNAGQVGSTRAAQYIAANRRGEGDGAAFEKAAAGALARMDAVAQSALSGGDNVRALWQQAAQRMSRCAAILRDPVQMEENLAWVRALRGSFEEQVRAADPAQLRWVYRLRDMLLSQQVYLEAMLDYVRQGGKSRGSALYAALDGQTPTAGQLAAAAEDLDGGAHSGQVQEVLYADGACQFTWRPVRPLAPPDEVFETVWRDFRAGDIF